MADEVERIEVGIDLVGEWFKAQAFLFKLVDDGLLPVRLVPPLEKGVERRKLICDGSLGVVPKALGDQLAVGIEILHPLGDDRDEHAVDVELPAVGLVGLEGDVVASIDNNLVLADLNGGVVGWNDGSSSSGS